MDPVDAARRYYECLDDDAYDDLRDLLDPDFKHLRPDRVIEGRDRFVSFMAEDRPRMDTVHAVDVVFEQSVAHEAGESELETADFGGSVSPDGSTVESASPDGSTVEEVAVRGRLFDTDGSELFAFVDIFRFEDGVATELQTFTR